MTPEEIYNAVKDLSACQVKKWYADNKITEEQKKLIKNTKMQKMLNHEIKTKQIIIITKII